MGRVDGVIYVDDIKDSMIKGFDEGYTSGASTFFVGRSVYDENGDEARQIASNDFSQKFSWLRKEVTFFGGIGNHGKSAFCQQLNLIQAVRRNWKYAVFSPENDPPDYFYNDLIHTLIGKNVDKAYKNNRATREQYLEALNFIKDKFFYVFPRVRSDGTVIPPTPEYINKVFQNLHDEHGVDGVVVDPFNQLEHDWESSRRDDRYISGFLQNAKRFAQINDVMYQIVGHPNSSVKTDDEGNFMCPNVYNIAGGAMWNNHCDNVIFVHRPYYVTDPANDTTLIRVSKIKKQKLVGIPGDCVFSFNRATNRYYIDGYSPFEHEQRPLELL